MPSDVSPRKAVFLDRDATIIEDMEFSVDPAELRPFPEAIEGMRKLQEAGYALVIITNQSGVARGYFDEAALKAVNDRLVAMIKNQGIDIEAIYYCPHYETGAVEEYAIACGCRKPEPGMLLRAAEEYGIDLAASWMVGDRPADVGAGRAAGCRTIRVLTGPAPVEGDPEPDAIADDLSQAADIILSR